MVLEVHADAREVHEDRDFGRFEESGGTDPRSLENER
jgi:hypothetical protein